MEEIDEQVVKHTEKLEEQKKIVRMERLGVGSEKISTINVSSHCMFMCGKCFTDILFRQAMKFIILTETEIIIL
jgi:hypothetical protein